jgi:hypothetical protein
MLSWLDDNMQTTQNPLHYTKTHLKHLQVHLQQLQHLPHTKYISPVHSNCTKRHKNLMKNTFGAPIHKKF